MSADEKSGSGSGSSATDSLAGASTGYHTAAPAPSAKTLLARAQANDELEKRFEAGRRQQVEAEEKARRAEEKARRAEEMARRVAADKQLEERKLHIARLEAQAAEEAKKKGGA